MAAEQLHLSVTLKKTKKVEGHLQRSINKLDKVTHSYQSALGGV